MARISKEKQEEIRLRILSVSKDKFTTIGFDKTSTKAIAKEVGIAEGTLFNYFDSKTEIFFESFGDDYLQNPLTLSDDFKLSDNVADVLFEQFNSTLGLMLKIPRGVIGELAVASVKMAKRKPKKFKRLMALDFQFIDELSSYIKQLVDHKVIKEVNESYFGEILFSVIGYELMIYVYDLDVKKEDMLQNIRRKIDILIKGYLVGGQHD